MYKLTYSQLRSLRSPRLKRKTRKVPHPLLMMKKAARVEQSLQRNKLPTEELHLKVSNGNHLCFGRSLIKQISISEEGEEVQS